jgi:hypothetical protein
VRRHRWLLLQSHVLHPDRHLRRRMIPIGNLEIPILILARDRDFLAIGQTGLDDTLEALRGGFEEGLSSDASDIDVHEGDIADGSTENPSGFTSFRAVFVSA